MGTLDHFESGVVFFDSAPVIYNFEGVSRYLPVLRPIFEKVEDGSVRAVSSTLTIVEVLTKPYRSAQSELIESYQRFFRLIGTIAVSATIAEQAAQIRARYGLKTPDAVQWATARVHDADLFLTNDREFKKLDDPRVILIEELLQEKL